MINAVKVSINDAHLYILNIIVLDTLGKKPQILMGHSHEKSYEVIL
jgi:hypothetical protein